MVKFKVSSQTAPSPYGEEHPRTSLSFRLTVDQMLTNFHQCALMNQAYFQCRIIPERVRLGSVRIQCNGDITIPLKDHNAEQMISLLCLTNVLPKDFYNTDCNTADCCSLRGIGSIRSLNQPSSYVVWQKCNETDFLLTMDFILFTNQGYPLQNSSLGQLHSDGGVVSIIRSSAGRFMLVYDDLSSCFSAWGKKEITGTEIR